MRIEERLVRRRTEDAIEIGRIMEKFYNGQGGVVLRAMINARISAERKIHQEHVIVPADRVLGRLEAYQNIIDDIELSISSMKQLTQEEVEDES